jgi:DNA-directed RNA polymerase subunit RPC12/RpoP
VSELVDVTCPNCDSRFETGFPDSADAEVACPTCAWQFEIDAGGEVTDDGEVERDPGFEVNEEGELTADALLTVRCPRCAGLVEVPEAQALTADCHQCGRTFAFLPPDQPPDPMPCREESDDEPADDEYEDAVCPNCGGDGSLYEYLGGGLWECVECGYQTEDVEGLGAEDSSHRERERDPVRTVFVSPWGDGDYTSLAEATRRCRGRTRILVQPGCYDERLHLPDDLEIVGHGQREDILLTCRTGPCLTVDGRSVRVVVRGLTIRGLSRLNQSSHTAVDVRDGELVLEDCAVTSDSLACVRVEGHRAQLILRRCEIEDGEHNGVQVEGKADVTLEDCVIRGNGRAGVESHNGHTLLRRCCVEEQTGEGIVARTGGQITVEDSAITGNGGAGAAADGGQVTLRCCRIHDGAAEGVVVREGGLAVLEGCRVYGQHGAGVDVKTDGRVVMKKCLVREVSRQGVRVRGQAVLDDCDITGCTRAGVLVRCGNLALRRCRVRSGRRSGLWLSGPGMILAENCFFLENGGPGVVIRAGATPLIRKCLVLGNPVGLRVEHGGHGTLEKCCLAKHTGPGVRIRKGSLLLRQCEIRDNRDGPGVRIERGGEGTLEGCDVVQNGRAGVEVRRRGKAVLRECRIHDNGFEGVWAHAHSVAMLYGCRLGGNQRGPCELEAGASVCLLDTLC